MHRWFISKEKRIQRLSQIHFWNDSSCQTVTQKHQHHDAGRMTQIQGALATHRYHLTHPYVLVRTCTCTHTHTHKTQAHARMSHNKWISPWPCWQLRSQFDVNSCWLSSAWSAYSTSSVILSMALWQGQLPWGKAPATTSCNKAPQGIHQAKRPPKSTEPFA